MSEEAEKKEYDEGRRRSELVGIGGEIRTASYLALRASELVDPVEPSRIEQILSTR